MTISNIHKKNQHHKNILRPVTWALKLSLLSIVLLPKLAFAGAGTNVYGCVYLNQVDTPMNFTFIPEGSQCMNQIGSSQTLTVTKPGVSCVSIGYIEQKDTDTGNDDCNALNAGIWKLSCSGGDGNFSGTVETVLYYHLGIGENHMDMNTDDSSPNINLCTQPAKCVGKSASWPRGTQGKKYIIFQPAANNASNHKAKCKAEK
jgi:hypothetical protein